MRKGISNCRMRKKAVWRDLLVALGYGSGAETTLSVRHRLPLDGAGTGCDANRLLNLQSSSRNFVENVSLPKYRTLRGDV